MKAIVYQECWNAEVASDPSDLTDYHLLWRAFPKISSSMLVWFVLILQTALRAFCFC